ncbi:NADH dehydrogenase subunit 5, partial [Coemansia reversa NRRL 1564]
MSYLLINFWFTRLEANKAAILALLMNRIGDWTFSMGIYIIVLLFGTLNFASIFSVAYATDENYITLICILLFLGAMAKSAQLGLNTWLPQAMEGPTPVSALLHAATMVTAGVYLLMRASPIFEYSDTILVIITLVGCTTALFAASIALMLNDVKKVIAYSTMSQLGYCFLACGISGYDIAIFHIVNHGFFKALLFMSAGSVLHALNDEQNTNKMGGLINILPFTYTVMLIGSLSLMALPFLTGFYSKDLILEFSYGQYLLKGSIGYWIGTTTAFLTSVYSIKILILTFMGRPNGPLSNYKFSHEPNLIMTIPLIFLAILSIFFGYILKDLFVGLGSDFWLNSIFIHPNHFKISDIEFSLPLIFKLLPLICSLLG